MNMMRALDEATAVQSVGLGWEPLVRRLYAAMPEGTEVVQVKEKFGGLRFYTNGTTEEFYAMIDSAGKESYSLCELCGQPGSQHSNIRGWLKTLCQQHAAERKAAT